MKHCWHHISKKVGPNLSGQLIHESSRLTETYTSQVIHHLNGIKSDNRPSNLLALPRKGHNYALVLQAVQEKLRGKEIECKLLEKALENNQLIFRLEEN